MTTAQVVVDTDHLDGLVVAELSAVCAAAGAEVLPWRALATSQPVLIVGSLARGERQIPAPLLDAVNAMGSALVLLSNDLLVRSVVTTHRGRVTLVAPSASSARLRGTIRMLLAQHGRFGREYLHPQVWIATFGATRMLVPALRQDPSGAVTAVFPFDPGWSGAEPLSVEAHRHASSQARLDSEERSILLRELFGRVAGMVHLSSDAREWSIYWPSSIYPLLLCSTQRLPSLCNLADQADTQVLHLSASPGDVVVGLSSPVALQHDLLAGGDGGAAFLEALELAAPERSQPPHGIVVEVR